MHLRKRIGVSVLSTLATLACAPRSRGPQQKTFRREFTSACRTGAGCADRLAPFGRLHRGEQECNAEVGRYPRRRWLCWNATRHSPTYGSAQVPGRRCQRSVGFPYLPGWQPESGWSTTAFWPESL